MGRAVGHDRDAEVFLSTRRLIACDNLRDCDIFQYGSASRVVLGHRYVACEGMECVMGNREIVVTGCRRPAAAMGIGQASVQPRSRVAVGSV